MPTGATIICVRPLRREYVHWNDHHYVRNLVSTNEDFELMVICWRYGQGSRVHNHAESHCWLTVLQVCGGPAVPRQPGVQQQWWRRRRQQQ